MRISWPQQHPPPGREISVYQSVETYLQVVCDEGLLVPVVTGVQEQLAGFEQLQRHQHKQRKMTEIR